MCIRDSHPRGCLVADDVDADQPAQAVVARTRAELGLRRLVSIHVVGNEASARVMVKLGMSLERETVQPDTGRQVRVYAMDL